MIDVIPLKLPIHSTTVCLSQVANENFMLKAFSNNSYDHSLNSYLKSLFLYVFTAAASSEHK